ncbi:MAG: hypothetical protein ACLS8T_30395 [Anaerobutyricum sp.]
MIIFPKPFSVNSAGKISAHLRHNKEIITRQKVIFRNLIIDYSDRSLYIKGHKIELSNKEFEIIQLLSSNAGGVLTEKKFMKIFGALTAMETTLLSKSIYEKYV